MNEKDLKCSKSKFVNAMKQVSEGNKSTFSLDQKLFCEFGEKYSEILDFSLTKMEESIKHSTSTVDHMSAKIKYTKRQIDKITINYLKSPANNNQ
jgi:hypothetical protein